VVYDFLLSVTTVTGDCIFQEMFQASPM